MSQALEPSAVEAISDIPRDLVVVRLENESIMAACAQRPRDMAQIKLDLQEQFELFPESAETSIYSKPVGKGEDGRMKFAEGLSIRAAETLAEVYGYNRVRCDVSPLDDDHVRVEATFTDFQRGRIWQDAGIVSRVYKTRGGDERRTPTDRFYNVTVRAEGSKRVREVILRCINASLKAWYFNACKKTMSELLTDERLESIVAYFDGIGCKLADLEKIVGRPKAMGWLVADRARLHGIANAIKENETTLAEVLDEATPSGDSTETSEVDAALSGDVAPREVAPEAEKASKAKAQPKAKPKSKAKPAAKKPDDAPTQESPGDGGDATGRDALGQSLASGEPIGTRVGDSEPVSTEAEAMLKSAEENIGAPIEIAEPVTHHDEYDTPYVPAEGESVGTAADPGEIIEMPRDFADMLSSAAAPKQITEVREYWSKKSGEHSLDAWTAMQGALDSKLNEIRQAARGR